MSGYKKLNYQAYMASGHWEARRRIYFKTHKRKCNACGYHHPREIHLHHLSYALMGKEPDVDLMPLCERCHRYVHAYAQVSPCLSLREATEEVVQKIKDSPPAAPRVKAPKIVPLRQRLTLQERKREVISGRQGRLGGLPIVRVTPSLERLDPPRPIYLTDVKSKKRGKI